MSLPGAARDQPLTRSRFLPLSLDPLPPVLAPPFIDVLLRIDILIDNVCVSIVVRGVFGVFFVAVFGVRVSVVHGFLVQVFLVKPTLDALLPVFATPIIVVVL